MDGQEAAANFQDAPIGDEEIGANFNECLDNLMSVVAANNIDSEGVEIVGTFLKTRCRARPGPCSSCNVSHSGLFRYSPRRRQ